MGVTGRDAGEAVGTTGRGGLPGCLLALVGAPLLGALSYALGGWDWAAIACLGALIGGLSWIAFDLTRGRAAGPAPMTWSFAPASAAVVAATDVVAVLGDATPMTYLLLALPCALLGAVAVFVLELRESGRPLYSVAKAVAAAVLIAVPLPVGGLLGAGASLGHRMIRTPPESRAS